MLQRGDAVISLAGRDGQKLLAVVAVNGQDVILCNGKDRPLHRPKKKNPKHIRPVGAVLDETQMRSDRALRKALAAVKANLNERECC